MLNDVKLPFVVRRSGIDKYSSFLLGKAYVNGFVHGEAWNLEDAMKVRYPMLSRTNRISTAMTAYTFDIMEKVKEYHH